MNPILLIILCFFLPPLAVFLKRNSKFDNQVIINIILCFLFWVPAVIHGLLVVCNVI